jgi:ketosteroid isomerase-like protein
MMKSKKIRDVIVATEKKFVAAYNRADAPGLAAFYTRDGQIMPPNTRLVRGSKAMQQMFKSFWKDGDAVIKLDVVEADGSGDIAYEVGKYALFSKTGKMNDQGKYIVVWKKVGGRWKLYRDIFNSNMPAKVG